MPLQNAFGDLALEATQARRYGGGKKAYAAVLTGNADITPAAGKAIRVVWVAFVPNSDNASSNLVTVGFVNAASSLYVGYAMAHWEVFTGPVGTALRISLANSQQVAVTVHYEEV